MLTAVWTLALAGYFFGLFYRANHKKIKTISNVDPSVVRTKGEEGEAAEEQTKQEIEQFFSKMREIGFSPEQTMNLAKSVCKEEK